jgi:translation elongation factor EF-G
LNRKAQEHDMLQMEVIDVQNRIDRMIENLEKDLRQCDEDLHKDCIDRINGVISSTDRRFDYVTNDINKLDKTVNPNKDLLKK